MTRKRFWYLLILIPLFVACSDPLDVDVSEIKVDITFEDVDAVLMKADSAKLINEHHRFGSEFTNAYAYLIGYCLKIGDVADTAFYSSIQEYRSDRTIIQMRRDIDQKFLDKKTRETKIIDGFKHLRFHLPDCHLPKHIIYVNSLFQSGVFCTEDDIALGLQQYLGADNEVVKQLNPEFYFDWMKKGFDARYLERDVLTGWIETHLVEETQGNLAEQMIRWGKILYLTEAAFPDEEQALILRYSAADLKWALENEYGFWEYLSKEQMLFKVDDQMTRNMIGDGPFTPGLPVEGGPDRMGQFLGWRMIHSYMEQFDISVKDLMALPYNDILQEYEIE